MFRKYLTVLGAPPSIGGTVDRLSFIFILMCGSWFPFAHVINNSPRTVFSDLLS